MQVNLCSSAAVRRDHLVTNGQALGTVLVGFQKANNLEMETVEKMGREGDPGAMQWSLQ